MADGKITDLGTSAVPAVFATAINDHGEIVGSVFLAESSQAARWRHGRLELLGDLPGGNAGAARNVNERGMILGAGNRRPDSCRLLDVAAGDIEQFTHRPVHLKF